MGLKYRKNAGDPWKSMLFIRGEDGFSPTIVVTDIPGGHRLTITDKNDTQTVDVMDGKGGEGGGGNANTTSVTIPAGRMRGDIDGDGFITSDDTTILGRHVAKISSITDATALLAADINNDGSVGADDLAAIGYLTSGSKLIGAYGEVSGNWTPNPNYETESYQFYTDISVVGMTALSSATVAIRGADARLAFRAECLDGAIRIYANLCPISELHAIVQHGTGDGTAIVVCESIDLSKATSTATIAIPAGIMYGDVDLDGMITENDVKIISDHVNKTELITGAKLYVADVDADGEISTLDIMMVNAVVKGTTTASSLGIYHGDWVAVTDRNYTLMGMNFYIDIPVNGITTKSSATVSMQNPSAPNLFAGECLDGAIRIYAKWCPRYEIKAVVQYGAGDGTAVVVCEAAQPTYENWTFTLEDGSTVTKAVCVK